MAGQTPDNFYTELAPRKPQLRDGINMALAEIKPLDWSICHALGCKAAPHGDILERYLEYCPGEVKKPDECAKANQANKLQEGG